MPQHQDPVQFRSPGHEDEIHASALQFVRKLSGFNSPSQANAEAFNRAVSEVSEAAGACWRRCRPTRAARPRGRGGEGEGTLAGAVRLGAWNRRKRSDRSPPNTGEGCCNSEAGPTLSTYSVEPNTMTPE